MSQTDRKHIQNIIDASIEGTLAIFVGAGVSKTSETTSVRLPTWFELIESLKHDLNTTNETDFLKIAQLYFLEFGETVYFKKLKGFFPEYIKPSLVHQHIFENNPSVIITTNWDNILERTIEESAYLYDVIAEDADLVKSSNPRRVIKMHGDFRHHNIVFKEDDYLNYQFNFPLIENYVKSVLSSHTVVFVGYSYSDFNLKQITKWIQHHSDAKPPMYLIGFEHNPTQIRYLENHGIATIVLDDLTDGALDRKRNLIDFLIRVKSQDAAKVIESDTDTINFLLTKLIALKELDAVLLSQVKAALINCDYIFTTEPGILLELYSNRATIDYNAGVRKIYANFKRILHEIDSKTRNPCEELKVIFRILLKANIVGIVYSEDDLQNRERQYIPLIEFGSPPEVNSDFLNFSYGN